MAGQQKETSSVDSKEGSSLLDEGIGKEFLSSWKSMSMADDDAMDFSFESVSKGKKKAFSFEKLDMDFNLDGEFDKISSFKVDISDLDFSCPPNKPSKSKEKKGESSGAKEGKKDGFDFSFDFNELDSFDIDSSLIKGDTTSTINLNKKGVTSDGSDSEGAKKPKPNDNEHVHASDDSMIMQPLASEVETSKVEILVGNQGVLDSIQDCSVSKFSSPGKLDSLVGARTTSDGSKTSSTEGKDQERELPEKTNSTESKSQDINNPPSQSVDQIDSNQDTVPDQHAEVYSRGTKLITGSVGKQNVMDNKATCVDSHGVNLLLEKSSPLQMIKLENHSGEAIKFVSSTQAEATNDLQPAKSDASFENNTKAGVPKKVSHDTDIKENQKSTLECHLAPASSEPVVDKVMLMKDNEIRGMQSKFFCKPEDNSPLKHQSSTAGTEGFSFGSKKIGDMQLRSISKARESFKSNDSECGSKLVSDSTPATSEPMRDELVLLGGKDDVKISSNAWEGIISDGIPSGGKLAGYMQSIHKEVKKSKTTLLETEVSSKDVNMLSSQVNPSSLTEKTARHATRMSVNPQTHISGKESLQNLRITSIEGNKLSTIKASKITPALSHFKTSRNVGTDKVIATSIRQKETSSSLNTEQHVELQHVTASKSDHLIDSAENQKPLTPSLKRKTIEVSEADLVSLRSLKRLSRFPSKSRSSKECPEKVVEQVESRPNNLLYNHPTSGLESQSEINLMDVQLPASLLMEDNGNFEKAEAYTKELEDICNMLKKKHEEAKELIVRAIVNNNNLLMLNHPIYEEKIQKVQKLAFKLMS